MFIWIQNSSFRCWQTLVFSARTNCFLFASVFVSFANKFSLVFAMVFLLVLFFWQLRESIKSELKAKILFYAYYISSHIVSVLERRFLDVAGQKTANESRWWCCTNLITERSFSTKRNLLQRWADFNWITKSISHCRRVHVTLVGWIWTSSREFRWLHDKLLRQMDLFWAIKALRTFKIIHNLLWNLIGMKF